MSKKIDRPKCDPGYRYLSKGEIVKKGDSFVFTDELGTLVACPWWSTCLTTVGKKVGIERHTAKLTFRRPLKVEQPQYRYLKEGEVFESGDEWFYRGKWELMPVHCLGNKANRADEAGKCERRRIKTLEAKRLIQPVAIPPAPVVQKYRPLKAGEKFKEGDEFFWFFEKQRGWVPLQSHNGFLGKAVNDYMFESSKFSFRRKVPADYKYEQPEVKEHRYSYLRVIVSDKSSRFYGVIGFANNFKRINGKKAYLIKYDTPQDKEKYVQGWFWADELEVIKLEKTPETKYRFLKELEDIADTDEMVISFNGEEPVYGPIGQLYSPTKQMQLGYRPFVGAHCAKFKKFRRKVE
jgi:hypothetical protein